MDFLAAVNWLPVLAEATEHGAEAAGGGNNLFPIPSHIIWTFVNFLILLWVLSKFMFKPLLAAIKSREQEIQGNLNKAAEDRTEAERLRREFTEQVAGAQRQAQEIISHATRNAQTEAERIIGESRDKATAEWERAQKQIQVEKERALAELREEVATLAVSVAGKVIERSLTDADHTRLAQKFVEDAGKN